MTQPPKYGYVLYIDEAGDDGLKRVQPIDANGASEWLVLSGYLVRAENESKCAEWLDALISDINCRSRALHYRKLSPKKQERAAAVLASHPGRAFVVASNKKNMKGYSNERAAQAGGQQWFYNWLVRVLLERVTDFCARDCSGHPGQDDKIRVIFSQRGGHSYSQTKAYFEKLRYQHVPVLDKRQIDFRFISFRLVDYVPHYMEAGLQFADIVASASYQAINPEGKRWTNKPALALRSAICKDEVGERRDFGVVLLPPHYRSIGLTSTQAEFFKHHGFSAREL
ncbi:DUF3800 domain-containing protein [Sulfitobacter mediterraneus]|uniref:DUF3800 domain-containing protein n=1 Tax=Sulfitobacter mediterraneus TaxID=83219 RepID=UPI0019314BD8|nr:DUF3800 domain-containing protein [Sulfitobacter mediterraneus]MBM1633548.1 DUF3800 domain-containing protein [Sulfitobacter mediterraneus]MBM1641937.1 DUF3800 domain-containing protein [Sulfitobacter mediterraneus]MBM1645412.1 DUF3800 domain-containing protein [Sulfitobacter mediterraneus]MBM1650056.1 DUF3800 domain-containing protein [Sulfitobacter mediterraneus]MBM1653481.1 DUF3800 domain-containing protein [Sulfitobacter mediterraneus]